jgi:hypothetical protein
MWAQSKSSIRGGVQVLRSSSTVYRRNRLAVVNLDEEALAEDSREAIQNGLLESSPTVHHWNRLVVDEALLEGSSWAVRDGARVLKLLLTRRHLRRSFANEWSCDQAVSRHSYTQLRWRIMAYWRLRFGLSVLWICCELKQELALECNSVHCLAPSAEG